MTRDERRPNQAQEPGVLLRAVRERLLQPLVVAARRDAEDATHCLHAVPFSMGLMNSYVRRTRPVLGFMDIGFALRGYRMLNDCPLNPGNSRVVLGVASGGPLQQSFERSPLENIEWA